MTVRIGFRRFFRPPTFGCSHSLDTFTGIFSRYCGDIFISETAHVDRHPEIKISPQYLEKIPVNVSRLCEQPNVGGRKKRRKPIRTVIEGKREARGGGAAYRIVRKLGGC